MPDLSKLSTEELLRLRDQTPAEPAVSPEQPATEAGTTDLRSVPTAQLQSMLASSSGEPTVGGINDYLYRGVQGAYNSLSNTLGAPVDITNWGLGMLGVPVSETPIGGSASIRGLLNAYGEGAKSIGLASPELKIVPENINQVPEQYRPSYRMGEVSGSVLPMMAAPFLAAGRAAIPAVTQAARTPTPSVATNLWRQTVAEAATNPVGTMRNQIPGTLGAGAGAYLAENIAPGSQMAQTIGQLVGGFAGAGTAIAGNAGANAAGGVYERARKVVADASAPFRAQTEAGQAEAAARALQPIINQSKENPLEIIDRLRTAEGGGATAGDLANSPALTGVQTYLAKDNAELANAVAAARAAAAANTQQGFQGGFAAGDVTALTGVARARQAAVNQQLDDLVTQAERRAQAAVGPIQPNSPGAREAVNVAARNTLEEALRIARTTETDLWNRVDLTQPIAPTNTLAAYERVRATMLPEDTVGPFTERVLARFRGPEAAEGAAPTPPPDIPFQDAKLLRTRLNEEAAGLRSQGRFNEARIARTIADGLLDDMSAVDDAAVATARDYSRALNDRFSRSFAGDVLGLKDTGAPSVRPALTLETAAAGQPERAAAQMREMQAAAAFAGEQPAANMQAAQQTFMRDLSDRVINPTTGRVNPDRVDAFMRDNAAVLDQFPQYRQQLETARDAERAFAEVSRQTGIARNEAENTSAFARVLKAGENPTTAVTTALRGANPVRDLNSLAALSRRGGDASVGGLRAAVLQHVMDNARVGGNFSYAKASELLNNPLSPNGPSLLKSLRDNNILNATQQVQIAQFLDKGLASEVTKATGIQVNNFGIEPGVLAEIGARLLSVRASSQLNLGGDTMGGGLQAANMVSGLAKRAISRLPMEKTKAYMAQALAAEDPEQLIGILERLNVDAFGTFKSIPGPSKEALIILRAAIPRAQSDTQFEEIRQ